MYRGEGQREFLPLVAPVGSRVVEVPAILLPLLGLLACLCCCLQTSAYEWLTPRWLDELTVEWVNVMFFDGSLGWPIFLFVSLFLALAFVPLGLLALLNRALKLPSLRPLWSSLESFSAYLETLLSSFSEGKLTLDYDGLSLVVGGVERSMSWRVPMDIRRWGVRSGEGRRSPRCYEVWELTQGEVQILLSRVVIPQKLDELSLPPEGGLTSGGKDIGLRVPKRYDRVFDVILWLGDVGLRDAQDRFWRERT